MKANLYRRLRELEKTRATEDRICMRIVVCALGKSLNLSNSTCTRRRGSEGIAEIVHLDGDREEISDEDLENFIASFPITDLRMSSTGL